MRHLHLRLRPGPWVFERLRPLRLVGSRSSPSPAKSGNRCTVQLFFGSLSPLQMPRPAHGLGSAQIQGPADFLGPFRAQFGPPGHLAPPSHPAGSASRAQPSAPPRLRRDLLSTAPVLAVVLNLLSGKIEDVVISGISVILFDVLCLKRFLFVFCPIFCLFSGEKY